MPNTSKFLVRASELRARAEEALTHAETMRDAEARRMMREIAQRYEILAQRVEEAAANSDILHLQSLGEARPMPNTNKFLVRARELRARAEEALTQIETMQDPEARRMMREIAERYEKLAQQVEQEAPDAGNR